MIQRRVVGIVGMGNVGTAAALALFASRAASEIILVDKDPRRAEGEALDLAHGQSLIERTTVRAGAWADLAQAQVIVLTAGVGQRPGETRLDLLQRNAAVFAELTRELDAHAPDAVLVVATNPVDVLTYVLQEGSARPRRRVLGTGTMLDTARFRAAIGAHFGLSPKSVHAYILGEHGDSEVAAWSNAALGGVPLGEVKMSGRALTPADRDRLFVETRDAAYAIIQRKGYTNLAFGLVISRLVGMILSDEKAVVTVSVRLSGEYGLEGVCLSLPAVVGRDGVEAVLPPPLDDAEQRALGRSAEVLKASLASLSPARSVTRAE